MQDLQLIGVHEDGEHLLLSGGDGARFRMRVDEPLRAAIPKHTTSQPSRTATVDCAPVTSRPSSVPEPLRRRPPSGQAGRSRRSTATKDRSLPNVST